MEESKENLLTAVSASQNPNRSQYFFAIEHKETGRFVGGIGYTVTASTPAGKDVHARYAIMMANGVATAEATTYMKQQEKISAD